MTSEFGKKYWDFYNSEIPKLPGTASLMLDWGMVDTCIEAMQFMNQSFYIKNGYTL